MEKILVITFTTEDNKNYKLTLKKPKDNLEKSAVEAVAQKIVDTAIFNTSKRVLKSFKKAVYVTTSENVL